MYLLNNFGDGCNITRNIVSRLVLRITPYLQIYKSNPKCLCSNYRPISILSPLSKIFEKCIHDQLYYYFDSHKLFSPDQYGFKKNSSTSDAVLDIYNCLLENLDNKLNSSSSSSSVFYSTTIKAHRNNAYHDIRPKKRQQRQNANR